MRLSMALYNDPCILAVVLNLNIADEYCLFRLSQTFPCPGSRF